MLNGHNLICKPGELENLGEAGPSENSREDTLA